MPCVKNKSYSLFWPERGSVLSMCRMPSLVREMVEVALSVLEPSLSSRLMVPLFLGSVCTSMKMRKEKMARIARLVRRKQNQKLPRNRQRVARRQVQRRRLGAAADAAPSASESDSSSFAKLARATARW